MKLNMHHTQFATCSSIRFSSAMQFSSQHSAVYSTCEELGVGKWNSGRSKAGMEMTPYVMLRAVGAAAVWPRDEFGHAIPQRPHILLARERLQHEVTCGNTDEIPEKIKISKCGSLQYGRWAAGCTLVTSPCITDSLRLRLQEAEERELEAEGGSPLASKKLSCSVVRLPAGGMVRFGKRQCWNSTRVQ